MRDSYSKKKHCPSHKALSVTQNAVVFMRGMVVGEVQLMLLALRVEGVGGGPISRKKSVT